jgi:hypothetical protein
MHTPSKQTAAALAAVTAYLQQQDAARLAAPRLIPADTYNQLYILYVQLRGMFEGK